SNYCQVLSPNQHSTLPLHDALPIFTNTNTHQCNLQMISRPDCGTKGIVLLRSFLDTDDKGFFSVIVYLDLTSLIGVVHIIIWFGDRKSTRLNSSHVSS